jgi:hypothetical protein
MVRFKDGVVAVNAVTAGAVASTTIVLGVPNTAETFPAASLVHGYRMCVPSKVTIYVVGAVADQPPSSAYGGVDDVVILYPVTPVLSVAVNRVIGIKLLDEGDVAVNPVTTGASVSCCHEVNS